MEMPEKYEFEGEKVEKVYESKDF